MATYQAPVRTAYGFPDGDREREILSCRSTISSRVSGARFPGCGGGVKVWARNDLQSVVLSVGCRFG